MIGRGATGRYHGATSTLVPIRMRLVWAAAVARVIKGSRAMRCSLGSEPSAVAGYWARATTGSSSRSMTQSEP